MPTSTTQEPTSPPAKTNLLPLAGVLIGVLLTYASTFTFGWVYDDPPQIPQNPNLQWNRLGFLFTHQLWASMSGSQGRFYRPFLSLWFLINKTLFGLNPHWFHVTSVVAHVTATALAFFIASRLLKDAGSALLAAAIFGLHPLQAESASWISSVNDPLAAALCFASFLAYKKAAATQRSAVGWWALSGLLFLSALLTKEVSVVLPGIILIDFWTDSLRSNSLSSNSPGGPPSAPSSRFPLIIISTYGLAAALGLSLRFYALRGSAPASSSPPWSTVVLTAPKILLFNLYRTVFPLGLSPHYDFRLIEAPNGEFLLTLLALLALAAFAIAAARRDPRLWTAFAWLILPVLPTLDLRLMNEDDFIHDRYTYMSMLGVALLTGFAYSWLRKEWIRKKWPQLHLVRLLAAAIVLTLAFASAVQSQYWANDVTLFSRAVSRAPENEWAQLNYGSALSDRHRYGDAVPHFVRSYELKPGWRAADFAGFSYQQSGDLPQAEHWFRTALQQNPALANAWFGLAQIRLAQHSPNQAIDFLNKALTIQPDAEGYHYELGAALEQASRPSEALVAYQRELQLYPNQLGAAKAISRLQAAGVQAR
ncbi:MAG: tetratricopeptide repeat protein [Candidatus Sulfotelmatobacter sp.]